MSINQASLEAIHRDKTGALIEAVVVDEAGVQNINQMLDVMGVEYQWHTGADLAKPVAMTKLVTDAKSLSA